MSDTSAEPAMSWVQQSIMTTETLMPFLGLTAKSWPPASWATADFSSAGWKRDDFSLSCSYIKDFENNWLYPDTEQKKTMKMLVGKRPFSSQMSQRLNIFSEIYEDFFFFLICASAQFTNKRSITLCTKHGSGKKQNQLQSFPLSCHRLLVIADSLRNIFTSIYTTYKWAALPAVHSHCCVSPVAVPRFANVCRAIYTVSSARGAALSSNDLVIFNPGTSFRWLTMWLHTCLCWHNPWDGTGTGTSNRRRGKAAKTKFIEICPQFFLCNNNNSYLS